MKHLLNKAVGEKIILPEIGVEISVIEAANDRVVIEITTPDKHPQNYCSPPNTHDGRSDFASS